MTEKLATVDLRKETLVIYSHSATEAGFWVMNTSFALLGRNVSDEELGSAILSALSDSRSKVPVPPRDADPMRDVMERMGIKTYSTYLKGTLSVGVQAGEDIEFVPKENTGMRNGFVEMTGKVRRIPLSASPQEVGLTVRQALEEAR